MTMEKKYHLVEEVETYTKTKCGLPHAMLVTEHLELVTCKRCLAEKRRKEREIREYIEGIMGF